MLIKESEVFSKYADTSKVWVFSCSRKASESECELMMNSIQQFFDGWERHGKKIDSNCEILYNQFIIIISSESFVEASGCSQDALLHFMESPFQLEDMEIFAPNIIFYEAENNEVHYLNRNEFIKNIQRNRIFSEDTVVYDTTLYQISSFKENQFRLKIKDCWHHKLYLANRRS